MSALKRLRRGPLLLPLLRRRSRRGLTGEGGGRGRPTGGHRAPGTEPSERTEVRLAQQVSAKWPVRPWYGQSAARERRDNLGCKADDGSYHPECGSLLRHALDRTMRGKRRGCLVNPEKSACPSTQLALMTVPGGLVSRPVRRRRGRDRRRACRWRPEMGVATRSIAGPLRA